jgi:ADP-heptose:LPS heptosyltransferase
MSADSPAAILSDKQLGDVLLLEPLSRLLAGRLGGSVAMYVNPAFEPMVTLMPHAHAVNQTRQNKHAELWTANWSSRAVLRSLVVRARKKHLFISQPGKLRWWYRLIFQQIVEVHTPGEYWSHYFWRAAGGEREHFSPPCLKQPPDDWRHPGLPTGPYVVLNPTAAWASKFWQPNAWAKVIEALSKMGVRHWVMTGGPTQVERAHCAEIAAQLGPDVVDISGRTSMRQYLHTLSRARMVLCVDGSASHLAQAWDVPTVTLFGHVFPLRWHWPAPRHRAVSAFDCTERRPPSTADVPPDRFIQASADLIASLPGLLD